MNYHIMIDDKFIESFIEISERVSPGKNIYVYTFDFPGKYVKHFPGQTAKYGSPALEEIFRGIKAMDRVYVHWFDERILPYIEKLNEETPLYLFLWGGDFLEQTERLKSFNLAPLTYKLVREREKRFKYDRPLPIRLAKMTHDLLTNEGSSRKLFGQMKASRKKFLSRLNYMCHWNPDDISIISSEYGGDFKFLPFFYDLGLQKIEPSFQGNSNKKNIIWLGNSATPTNNHLDVFKLLEKFKSESWELHAPLSYGQEWYADEVIREGTARFGSRFHFLRDFMPLNQYLKLLEDVDVVIMNHHRSQAGANIFAFIYMGKKVYLSKRSSVFGLMLREGIKVFDVESINSNSFAEFLLPLSIEQQKENSQKLIRLFSEEKRHSLLSTILN